MTGLSPAIFSREVSRRGPSSAVMSPAAALAVEAALVDRPHRPLDPQGELLLVLPADLHDFAAIGIGAVDGLVPGPPPARCLAATFYTMYRRRPTGDHQVGVCTNTRCAVMGGDAIFAGAPGAPGRRQRRDHRRRQGHPGAHRVQRGLRLRAGGDGQLGVLRQPDPGERETHRRRPVRGAAGRAHAAGRRCARSTRPPGSSPVSPTRATERWWPGGSAGPASLGGLSLARGEAAPARVVHPRERRTAPREAGAP
ncbi:hypothetical protein SVIOM74S_10174 [Streptomyces violarus]